MSPAHHHKRETCRLCESKNVKLVLPLNPTPPADQYLSAEQKNQPQEIYPLDLYLCLDCGHAQLLDVIDPAVLFRNYLYVTSSSLGLVDHYRSYAKHVIERFSFRPGSLVVEVGSNDGSLLHFFKEQGLKVLGVDPARQIAAKATEAGLETWPEFFNLELAKKIRKEKGGAALVAANNVFAHNDNLPSMADGVEHLLLDDGIFVFEVPYLGDLVEKKLFDTIYHEHLGYQSARPLQIFLKRHSLELIAVDRIPTKAGSLRCFAQKMSGPRKREASVADILAYEKRIKLDQPETYRQLSSELEKLRAQLKQLVEKIKADGKKIAGYGASPSSTTLIYYFGLENEIEFLVDDNPIKHGRFSPGCHLPVLPSSALEKNKPDYVIALAWTYIDPILKRNEAFHSQGGKFILPLPDVRVI